MKRLLIVAAAFLVAGCGAAPPASFDAHGTLTLTKYEHAGVEGSWCRGEDGYADIAGGTQVKITDSTGSVVALGVLSDGVARQTTTWMPTGTSACVFGFDVTGIPVGDGGIFGVEVSHRGVIQFTQSTASSLALTLD